MECMWELRSVQLLLSHETFCELFGYIVTQTAAAHVLSPREGYRSKVLGSAVKKKLRQLDPLHFPEVSQSQNLNALAVASDGGAGSIGERETVGDVQFYQHPASSSGNLCDHVMGEAGT